MNIKPDKEFNWDMIIPCHFSASGTRDLLFYDREAGEAEFCVTDGVGGVELLRRHDNWRSTWDALSSLRSQLAPGP
jgi:hypothetical protein